MWARIAALQGGESSGSLDLTGGVAAPLLMHGRPNTTATPFVCTATRCAATGLGLGGSGGHGGDDAAAEAAADAADAALPAGARTGETVESRCKRRHRRVPLLPCVASFGEEWEEAKPSVAELFASHLAPRGSLTGTVGLVRATGGAPKNAPAGSATAAAAPAPARLWLRGPEHQLAPPG